MLPALQAATSQLGNLQMNLAEMWDNQCALKPYLSCWKREEVAKVRRLGYQEGETGERDRGR